MNTTVKEELRQKRRFRIRKKVLGTAERPRLAVFRSNKHFALQVIDDAKGATLASVFTHEKALKGKFKGNNKSAAKEARPFKGSIGVTIRRVTDGAAHALNVTPARGALVVGIDENGPAEAAGIEPADVIVKVDGKDVKECRDLPRIVADTTAGKDVALTIIRKGKELTKTVKIGQLEDDVDKQASFTSKKGSAPQEEPVAVDPKSEAAAKHPAPGMAIFEIQQQPVSSDPLLLVLPVPPRFGRRRFDHVSKVSH